MIEDPQHAYSRTEAELLPLRLKAAQELFEERREQIPLVKKRADDAGITSITKLEDLVPLLFAHTVYKSYPASFVENGRWDRMLDWIDTLAVPDMKMIDVEGVKNVDDWLDRLWGHDHRVLATSGSSGKCSFLNHTAGDQERKKRHFKYSVAWPYQVASKDRPVFWLGPLKGPNSAIEAGQFAMENWGAPGKMYSLTQDTLRISEVSQMASMRKKMADGSAAPDEIAEFEAMSAKKAAKGAEELRALADTILDHRHEPIYLIGFWAQHLAIIERARERGIGDGEFHPDSIIGAGGGIKGVALPPDYRERFSKFYGKVLRPGVYAMTELSQPLPRCEAGHYHAAPGLIMLLLDASGEKLLNPPPGAGGVIEGRFGFLDLAYEGRWGGLITGDKVTVDFAPTCQCGRPGPVIHDTITRFAQLGQDDHIGCAGTIDAYIKGVVA
jgi:hypothetical protein